jgi:hypothetical protein
VSGSNRDFKACFAFYDNYSAGGDDTTLQPEDCLPAVTASRRYVTKGVRECRIQGLDNKGLISLIAQVV